MSEPSTQGSLLRVYKKVGKQYNIYWTAIVPPTKNSAVWYAKALRNSEDTLTDNQQGIRALYEKETDDRIRQGDIVCIRGEQCYVIEPNQ